MAGSITTGEAPWTAGATTEPVRPVLASALPACLYRTAHDTEREFEAADSQLSAVPWLAVTDDQLQSLPLSGRAGFVLSLIDDRYTVETLLDINGMREDKVLGILAELMRLGAVELRDAQ